MATITSNQYNDDGTTSRSAGEVLTINGATFTQRTDTRWHATAPASMTGTYADILPSATLGGKFIIDATTVRWLPFISTQTLNVPAIGTDVTMSGVTSSYLLAVYSNIAAAPSAVGTLMPASGFLKFRSVTGAFSAGLLTGIDASATGPDVAGWLEVVMDQAAGTDLNFSRLAEFETRGNWFYLANTDGSTAQVLQVPTNGGGANTFCPGVWIESSPGSNVYEMYPALGTTCGWARGHIGSAGLDGANDDKRQQFVKGIGSGQMQIGENVNLSATYTQPSYVSVNYTWAANVVQVTSTAHGLRVGEQVYLDFLTGGASADGVYTIIANAANTFNVALAGSGTAGTVTAYARSLVNYTAHGLAIGNLVFGFHFRRRHN